MNTDKHPVIFRQDYQVPEYCIDTIFLTFQLRDNHTDVIARTEIRKNPQSNSSRNVLFLNGENLELISLSYNDTALGDRDYDLQEKGLSIPVLHDNFTLEITTRIYPDQNTSLEGLYRSSGNYCSQCEAEGFRKITYYIDRPDILTTFTTRIEGDKALCPVMLSNGNMIENGPLDDTRHYAVWHDPFPKPCYLFALVAGKLVFVEDFFITASGRKIILRIYVEERNIDKCDHAMRSLKKSMRWDEDVYGREYDLDIFMIVAVDDFNMGAMENKGLNIFNSKFILALPETATDSDYLGIEGVVAHEYFHNWTGNRVTCRDWFQLSLKEGLTVFRDQEFSSDINSRAVQRIDDVRILRTNQFREDSGPMAHPVRPDSYVEINNFYTVTVYNKGAEVIRMMHTLLGESGFRKGTDLYFERHDGQAVTCDDFVAAMADANSYDLEQFKRWYYQAGTPVLEVKEHFDETTHEYAITVKQSCMPTPGQQHKEPFHIPIVIGLLDDQGESIHKTGENSHLLELKKPEETFTFTGFGKKPVLSFLRNFSAPVLVKPFQTEAELAFLMSYDSDLYNRWEASSQLAEHIIFDTVRTLQAEKTPVFKERYLQAVAANISTGRRDAALLAQSLRLPPETYLAGLMEEIDPDNLHQARNMVRREVGSRLQETFMTLYLENNDSGVYDIRSEAMGRRSLKNSALEYLMALEPLSQDVVDYCLAQYENRANMTDVIAALSLIANSDLDVREDILQDFYDSWHHDPLVMDKWFIIQATSRRDDTLVQVERLMANPSFSIKNPNKVRALIGAFGSMNHVRFHERDGRGYAFVADRILELNSINPQIAARLVSPFTTWKKYDSERQLMMRDQLERILESPELSGDVFEIVKKSI